MKWQNELNLENLVFFEKSDAIFLNYFWKEEQIERSAERGGERRKRVLAGVDLFGRGSYGGGKMNSWKAVKLALQKGTSVALFAQGHLFQPFSTFLNLATSYSPHFQSLLLISLLNF